MAKWRATALVHLNVQEEVEADGEDEALDKAREILGAKYPGAALVDVIELDEAR